jgi:hypothetical protein
MKPCPGVHPNICAAAHWANWTAPQRWEPLSGAPAHCPAPAKAQGGVLCLTCFPGFLGLHHSLLTHTFFAFSFLPSYPGQDRGRTFLVCFSYCAFSLTLIISSLQENLVSWTLFFSIPKEFNRISWSHSLASVLCQSSKSPGPQEDKTETECAV